MAKANQEQQHPQASRDRAILNNLLVAEQNEYNLAELARLRIRYRGFPGARDIWRDLDTVLLRWKLTEEALFEKTREIHSQGRVYRVQNNENEDWI